jgi:hypothetical protein
LYSEGIVRVNFDFNAHAPAVWRLVEKYRDLADASLVRMSELHTDCIIWTTDAHFRVYRRHGRQMIALLNP